MLSDELVKIVNDAISQALSRRNLRLVSQNGISELLAQLEAAKVREHVYDAIPFDVQRPRKTL